MGIDWGYTNITRAEGIEHGCVSVEQQTLLGRQSASAKVGNEVREKNSVSQVPRRKIIKDNWTKKENRKLWECYLRSKPKKRGYRKSAWDLETVVQIVTEEEYIDLFATRSDDKTFYEDWSEIGLESTEETCKSPHSKFSIG